MSRVTITIRGDWDRQGLDVKVEASDETIKQIRKYILRKLADSMPKEDKG